MNIKRNLLLLFIMYLFILCGKPVFAEEYSKNLTIILVPDFSFQEVTWLIENGHEDELWKTGGMSAVNIRPDGPYSYLNNIVSIASGSRGLGVEGWNAFVKGELDSGVLVEELYQQWTGRTVDEGKVFHPLFHKLVDKNKDTTYRTKVGILGQTLKEHGVNSYVIGNSDIGQEKVRYGPTLIMDREGFAHGYLLEGTKPSKGSPGGVVMDVDNIFTVLSTPKAEPSLTVIEWGDLYRLYKQKSNMEADYFEKQYETALLNLEKFLTLLVENGYTQNIMLLSPMMNSDAYQNKERLAPLFYWSHSSTFYLQSSTTRQPFVVSNLDMVPTILHFFEIEAEDNFFGKPIQRVATIGPTLEEGLTKIDLMFTIFKTRNVILSSYITLLVLLLIITSVIIMFKIQIAFWKEIAKILLIAGISSPLWLLITPYSLYYIQPNVYLILLIFCSYITGFLVVRFVPKPIFFMSIALFSAITIDLLMGNFFMQRSYLGYDPIIGARYYGIGNEFAGVYLIAGLLLLERPLFRRWLLVIVLSISQLFLLSSTNLGANAGATISAGIMFGYYGYRNYFPNMNWRKLMMIFLCLLAVTILFLLLTQMNGKESHIGYAFTRMFQGDFQYIVDTIKRKLEMNWKIFRFSNWTQLFVTTYLLIALYLWRKKGIVSSGVKRLLIQTGVVASVTLLLLNDSGVVAAATSMFIIVCTSYYWALDE
ncbi:hypothetical protein DS745_10340 [Anaerobacillus alkaliphilus]|uniref:Uncharacterized protein n=1 Tax=Anaerobacillus alkaliphilus TaxID=1548597 RepID=A0A4Q0VTH9_9BACI|nr:hypothetical protein [Anaerobacillus alkaliphilus]RXJ01329.1 hypothetical protein DS745_10340 [Anaerobacillus alkaliphilus]